MSNKYILRIKNNWRDRFSARKVDRDAKAVLRAERTYGSRTETNKMISDQLIQAINKHIESGAILIYESDLIAQAKEDYSVEKIRYVQNKIIGSYVKKGYLSGRAQAGGKSYFYILKRS